SRDHVRRLLPLVRRALESSGSAARDIDGVAYTAGPGLIGALLTGAALARSLAYAWGVPALGVHHLEGHLLAPLLEPDPPPFPHPMLDRAGLEFSFSGLKTAVLHALRGRPLTEQLRADVARAVEEAIVETLTAKALRALDYTGLEALVVSGGVSANRSLRSSLTAAAARQGARVYYPRIEFSTDNAAMIAVAGLARLEAGQHDGLAIEARARWPLESLPGVRAA